MKKRLMVLMGVMGLLVASGPVWSAEPPPADKEAQFQARKAKVVKELESMLTCVKAANAPAEMKRCQEAQKERAQSDKLQRIQQERKKLDEREQKLKEQRQPEKKE